MYTCAMLGTSYICSGHSGLSEGRNVTVSALKLRWSQWCMLSPAVSGFAYKAVTPNI